MPRVTVSIPYHGTPDTIRRAVDAVLAQTHSDLLCVVTCDGDTATPPWPALADLADPRLVRFALPENRGRYYADATVLAASSTPWFTMHDADDAADPRWLETMLAAAAETGAEVVLTAQTVHQLNGRAVTMRPKPWTGRYAAHGHMAGLWSTAWLRSIGGPHPGYRVGYDTIMTGAACALGAATLLQEPLYHRHRRAGSLTTAPGTGMKSAVRAAVVKELRRLWPLLSAAAAVGPDAVREVLASTRIGAGAADTVAADAARLREILDGTAAQAPVAEAVPVGALATPGLWSGWALDDAGARLLASTLADRRPRTVVEAGSGSSTVLLAEYARDTGARVVTLEHQARFRDATLRLLADRDLEGFVDLRLAPLRPSPAGPWYDTALPDGIDLALVDGPPESTGGRAAALGELLPHLAADAVLLLDDADRRQEQAALEQWRRWGAIVDVTAGAGKPVAVVRLPAPTPVDASDVVVTLLTGDRPDLLASTLASLRAGAPGLLETSHLVILDNGDAPATATVLGGYADVIDVLDTSTDRIAIGPAVSHLAEAAAQSRRPFWLHVEDDWQALPGHPDWLDTARRILATQPDVYQVRLRHQRDPVLARHMVTRQPIRWRDGPGHRTAAAAHLTMNPNLTRTSDIARVWPAAGERDAQAHAHQAGLRQVAQLVPGVFTHTGAGESRRALTGCQR